MTIFVAILCIRTCHAFEFHLKKRAHTIHTYICTSTSKHTYAAENCIAFLCTWISFFSAIDPLILSCTPLVYHSSVLSNMSHDFKENFRNSVCNTFFYGATQQCKIDNLCENALVMATDLLFSFLPYRLCRKLLQVLRIQVIRNCNRMHDVPFPFSRHVTVIVMENV